MQYRVGNERKGVTIRLLIWLRQLLGLTCHFELTHTSASVRGFAGLSLALLLLIY